MVQVLENSKRHTSSYTRPHLPIISKQFIQLFIKYSNILAHGIHSYSNIHTGMHIYVCVSVHMCACILPRMFPRNMMHITKCTHAPPKEAGQNHTNLLQASQSNLQATFNPHGIIVTWESSRYGISKPIAKCIVPNVPNIQKKIGHPEQG